MDREAWWAIIHGVAKESDARLSDKRTATTGASQRLQMGQKVLKVVRKEWRCDHHKDAREKCPI